MVIILILIAVPLLGFLAWYLFWQKIPLDKGCLCNGRTRMQLDMNYDCPLHGHWRSSMQSDGF